MPIASDGLTASVAGALAGERHLPALDRELVELGVASSCAVLDDDGTREHARRALELGATPAQVTEVLVTVSVLGMHTLTSGVPVLADVLRDAGASEMTGELDDRRRALRERHVGDDGYWDAFEAHLPGFLDGLLRLAPETFDLFFAYSALPWRSGALSARLKEQLYVAIDSTPTHVYVPGLRLHAANALRLGTTLDELAEVLIVSSRGDEATARRAVEAVCSSTD